MGAILNYQNRIYDLNYCGQTAAFGPITPTMSTKDEFG